MIKDNSIKNQVRELMIKAVSEAIYILEDEFAQNKDKSWVWTNDYHSEFPTMNWSNSVFPSFYLSNFGKINYHKVFSSNGRDTTNKSWRDYHNFVLANDELCAHMLIGKYTELIFNSPGESVIETWNAVHTFFSIGHILDGYIHKFGWKFDLDKFDLLFTPFYNSLALEDLPTTIYVPIIFCTSAVDYFQISDKISFEKLGNEVQLSRNIMHSYNSSGHPSVMSGASHAFVIRGWSVPNQNEDLRQRTLSNLTSYNGILEIINRLFAALRIAQPCIETGYFQIIASPENWTIFSKADLLGISVVSDKNYPKYFEDYGWLAEAWEIKEEILPKLRDVYEVISGSNYFDLAVKRLNKACLNNRDDDSILDISIALESLLTSDSKSEITYRLATRAVLLNKKNPFKNYDSGSVFLFCKKLYDFRSAVVHGDAKHHKKSRTLKISSQDEVAAVCIGIEYLEHVLITLIGMAEIRKPDDIDKFLF